MARCKTHINLLLSCPEDVTDERSIVREVIDEFNRNDGGLYIDLRHWQSDAVPMSGSPPQDIINAELVDDADMIVAIFWTRFGTPTQRYSSGTEEEISTLLEAGRNVFLYFCDKPVPPSKLEPEESRRIAAFRKQYAKEGLYWMYGSPEEFEKEFRRHITQYFHDYADKYAAVNAVRAAFHNAAQAMIDYGYYYDQYCFTMTCIVDERERVIEKTIERSFEIRSFGERTRIDGLVLASHKSHNVSEAPVFSNVRVDVDGEQENDFTVRTEKNKSGLETMKGLDSVTQIVLNKPLYIDSRSPRKIAFVCTTRVALSNKVHAACPDAPCRGACFSCHVAKKADAMGCYRVGACAFGAIGMDGYNRPIETADTLALTHGGWLLPRDGAVFMLLRVE